MKQADTKFKQLEHDALARIMSNHKVSSALLIFRCDDGSQAHVTIIEAAEGEGREDVEKLKNLVALDLLRVTAAVIEEGKNRTTDYVLTSGK